MNNARWLVINLCLSHHYKGNSHKIKKWHPSSPSLCFCVLILPSLEHVWAWFGSYHLVWSRTKKRVITLLIPRNHAHYRDIQRIHMNSKLSSAISDCLYDLLHYVSMSNELEKKTRDYGFAPTTVSFFLAQWTKITRRCIFNTAISNWTLG